VSLEDVKKCEEKYNKSKSVHSILRHTAQTEHVSLDQLYTEFAWPLYRKFPHAYDALEMIAKQERDRVSELASNPNLTPEQLNDALSQRWLNELNIDPKLRDAYLRDILSNLAYVNQLLAAMEPRVRNALLQNVKNRLTPQITKIRCDLEVSCFKYEGIDAIQAALRAGEACGTKDTPISIKLVAPPLYVIMCNTLEITKGIELLKKARDTIRDVIRSRGGEMNVKVEPRAVNARDEKQLAETFEALEKQNAEVAGDEPDMDQL
jgi:translation initiation factor 2 subunit 1